MKQMEQLEHFRIDPDTLPRYPTMHELERLTGRPARWVQRQLRHLELQPAFFKGERQVTQADALRLVLLSHLQRRLGERSPTPRLLVESAASAIRDLLQNPHGPTLIALNGGGSLGVVVCVPNLQELLAAS